MVADVHRTLKYGGIFMYPATGLFKCLLLFEPLRGSVCVQICSSRTSPIYLVVPQHPTPTASCESCTSVCPWLTSSNRLEELQAPDCKFHNDNEYVIPAKGMTTLKVPTLTGLCISQEAHSGHLTKEASWAKPDLPRQPRRCERRTRADQEEPRGLKRKRCEN